MTITVIIRPPRYLKRVEWELVLCVGNGLTFQGVTTRWQDGGQELVFNVILSAKRHFGLLSCGAERTWQQRMLIGKKFGQSDLGVSPELVIGEI